MAKVTLNIAKKIAFEERKAQAFALAGQIEMDIDPSLPLDNLDKNIVCADALFTEWPEVDAIVGNPPFLGTQSFAKNSASNTCNAFRTRPGWTGLLSSHATGFGARTIDCSQADVRDSSEQAEFAWAKHENARLTTSSVAAAPS